MNHLKRVSPFVSFKIIDNPYNSPLNSFHYKFIIPIHIQIRNNSEIGMYSMLFKKDFFQNRNILNLDIDTLYPKIETLFKEFGVNTQTSKLKWDSLSVQYNDDVILDKKDLKNYVYINDSSKPVNENTIHFSDIYIPLNISHDSSKINNGIWNQIK